MYLHQISFPKKELVKDHKEFQNVYSMHQIIWGIISKDKSQERNFLYRVEYDDFLKIKYVYLLASTKAESKSNRKIKVSSRYQPQLEKGESLYFKLRANPIVKRKENGRTKEYSIIMDAKHKFKKNGQHYQDKYSLSELIHETGFKWLLRKGNEQHGFSIKPFEVKIENDREFIVSPPKKKSYKLRVLDFEGKLTITDPDLFKKGLFNGIGSAKAFGCGLMLVKRI